MNRRDLGRIVLGVLSLGLLPRKRELAGMDRARLSLGMWSGERQVDVEAYAFEDVWEHMERQLWSIPNTEDME